MIPAGYDKTDPMSIYNYSKQLLDHTLDEWMSSHKILEETSGDYGTKVNKGDLGQNVERYFFGYEPNNRPLPDFEEANVELKVTGLKESSDKNGNVSYKIKERLVCDIINYMDDSGVAFKESKFYKKCLRMLVMFYLYEKKVDIRHLKFLKTILWKLPEKDLLIIKQDYDTIIGKIDAGLAHELSEGDTMYLAACRKGSGGDKDLRRQPYSSELAYQRAFSLKTSYMRTILKYLEDRKTNAATNFVEEGEVSQLVSIEELETDSFFNIILNRFTPYLGLNYNEIVRELDVRPSTAKHKYALLASAITRLNRGGTSCNLEDFEEFQKSGIVMKTVRVNYNWTIEQSMSFENIDYVEIFENDVWEDSRLYEILTTPFLFVVFKELEKNSRIEICGKVESEYRLEKVFFWRMPKEDLEEAKLYWENIRKNVLQNTISLDNFYRIDDHMKFHVRPKGTVDNYRCAAVNPNGGMADKYCYWFNSEYVKSIIKP